MDFQQVGLVFGDEMLSTDLDFKTLGRLEKGFRLLSTFSKLLKSKST